MSTVINQVTAPHGTSRRFQLRHGGTSRPASHPIYGCLRQVDNKDLKEPHAAVAMPARNMLSPKNRSPPTIEPSEDVDLFDPST